MNRASLLHAIGRPIAFHPGLVPVLGSVNAVLFFGQIFYWQDKTDCPIGVYKSSEEIQQETGLTYREQSNAREKLRDCGVLIETEKRLEHRIYFRIDFDALDALLANCEKRIPRNDKSAVRETTKAQSDETTKAQSVIQRLPVSTAVNTAINLPPTPQGGDEDEIPADWKADSRRFEAMSLDWEPDPNTLGAYLNGKAANGRPVTEADVQALLPDWRQSANASGKTMTDAQWTLRLVKYVMACMTSDSATPTNRRASAPQEDPLAFTEENRPERGPYALFKPGPKKTPMTDEGRARVEQLRRQAFGDAA